MSFLFSETYSTLPMETELLWDFLHTTGRKLDKGQYTQ